MTFNCRSKPFLFILILVLLVFIFFIWGLVKPLPSGLSTEGDFHVIGNDSIQFLGDLTFLENDTRVIDQEIFQNIYDAIGDAQEFIVIDMFLFTNEEYERTDLIPLAQDLTDELVLKKNAHPEMQIVFITDYLNTFYSSDKPNHISQLEDANISVIYSNTNKLRNSNPIYSTIWDMTFRQIGLPNFNGKLLPNFITSSPEKIGLRSALKLVNFKANHRKVFISERDTFALSANPHIGSSLHSNVGIRVQDSRLISDVLQSEQAVLDLSGSDVMLPLVESDPVVSNHTVKVALRTEEKIRDEILSQIELSDSDTEIKIAMFYFSDRKIIKELKSALKRGVSVELLLDANKDAFGREKNGIPNRQVASELVKNGAVVRWYNTQGEQFHTKLFIKIDGDEVVLILGSANFTKRNIGNLNLETNFVVLADLNDTVIWDTLSYWDKAWSQQNSLDYEAFKDDSWMKYLIYRFQEWSGLSSF